MRKIEGAQTITLKLGRELREPMTERSRDGDVGVLDLRKHLARYFYALAEAEQTLGLSRDEALLCCDALNGVLSEPHTIGLAWAEVADAIQNEELAQKWDVDGPALVEKLHSFSYWQALALVDCVERWWLHQGRPEYIDYDELLRAIGLLPKPRPSLTP